MKSLLMLAGLSLVWGTAVAEEKFEPMRALHLYVQVEKNKYTLSESLEMKTWLENEGDRPLRLFGDLTWGFGGSFLLITADKNGVTIRRPLVEDSFAYMFSKDLQGSFVKLFPGHWLGVTRLDRVSELVPGPGRYQLYVEYRSPAARGVCPTPDCIVAEDGVIESAHVWVDVKRK